MSYLPTHAQFVSLRADSTAQVNPQVVTNLAGGPLPNFRGAWDTGTAYVINDVVTYISYTWIALAPNIASAPADLNTDWSKCAKAP